MAAPRRAILSGSHCLDLGMTALRGTVISGSTLFGFMYNCVMGSNFISEHTV